MEDRLFNYQSGHRLIQLIFQLYLRIIKIKIDVRSFRIYFFKIYLGNSCFLMIPDNPPNFNQKKTLILLWWFFKGSQNETRKTPCLFFQQGNILVFMECYKAIIDLLLYFAWWSMIFWKSSKVGFMMIHSSFALSIIFLKFSNTLYWVSN